MARATPMATAIRTRTCPSSSLAAAARSRLAVISRPAPRPSPISTLAWQTVWASPVWRGTAIPLAASQGFKPSQVLQVKLPVAPEIQRSGNDGQRHRRPDGQWFKPFNPRFPKKVEAKNRRAQAVPVQVTVENENRDDRHDLRNGLVLAITLR